MADLLTQIHATGLVPVVKIDRVEDAVPLAKALVAGGLNIAEVTFRTDCAKEAMLRIKAEVPEMLVGAGTVLTTDQVDQALEAGAKFIVSPGLNPVTVKYCQAKGVPILPGCANASDIELALSLGLTTVKFFPAEANGGIKTINALAGPFPQVRFMPTGGVSESNLASYLSNDKILACGGTWMVKDSDILNGEFAKITQITKQAVQSMHDFKVAHIGLNSADEAEAKQIASLLSLAFGFEAKEGASSIFVSKEIEVMKEAYLGDKGHIAIAVNNIVRAQAYLESKGFTFNQSSQKMKQGKLIAIYMNETIGGFAFHLLQR